MNRFAAALRRPPWRTVVPLTALMLVGAIAYALWQPGKQVTDGQHDRGRNGIWLQHGWIGGDAWFSENDKTEKIPQFRDPARIRSLTKRLAEDGITDLFPHLCPVEPGGSLPPVDDAQTERFLDLTAGRFRVLPWVGGPLGDLVHPESPEWRHTFTRSVRQLLDKHPRLAGVHLNVEPWPTGNRDMLTLLDELRAALPKGKLLTVAAYPPPTIFHVFPQYHWEEAYYRKVAGRADGLAVMLYDTALRLPKLYQNLMADWTTNVLRWSGSTPVLLGLPAYEDTGVGYHDPATENLENALRGIHAGLERFPTVPDNYQGTAIYSDWVMDEAKWATYRREFGRVR